MIKNEQKARIALITGASSGIGRDMARVLHKMGVQLYLVARREELLLKLKEELDGAPEVIALDLGNETSCTELYERVKDKNIDILINNAGFGAFGEFLNIDLSDDLEMLDVNVKAVHTLTKLFLPDFEKRNSGYILNVASAAAFLPGPLMATYYATKAYVERLSLAISEELRQRGSAVYIGTLCPGPVDTEFNNRAGVSFSLKALESFDVAQYGIKKMFKEKRLIVPGVVVRLGVFFQRFLPTGLLLKISYRIQNEKG